MGEKYTGGTFIYGIDIINMAGWRHNIRGKQFEIL
jgi:hypothetical protein